ncbi:hypothetical protein J6590_035779 [Homalodisca vitripennis]|nr:hypothetical protein J6590_035779 [Homalodisca vitripennis]
MNGSSSDRVLDPTPIKRSPSIISGPEGFEDQKPQVVMLHRRKTPLTPPQSQSTKFTQHPSTDRSFI